MRQGHEAAYPRFASESPSQQHGEEGGGAAYPRFTSVSAPLPSTRAGPTAYQSEGTEGGPQPPALSPPRAMPPPLVHRRQGRKQGPWCAL